MFFKKTELQKSFRNNFLFDRNDLIQNLETNKIGIRLFFCWKCNKTAYL